MKKTTLMLLAGLSILTTAPAVHAQYAVGHRSFGGGTALGGGYSRMDYAFPGIEAGRPFLLLPTLELKFFLADTMSIDISAPVANIAASNALQDYFFFTAEAFINFHPSAPSPVELFIAPGLGISYARWSEEDAAGDELSEDGYAFHVPVRIGFELNNARRNYSMFIAVRPFFSLVHGGSGGNEPGGGAFVELGFMAYSTTYRANRY